MGDPGTKTHYNNWPNHLGFQNDGPQDNKPVELPVTGKFPTWTAGKLLRVGPGLYKVDRTDPKKGAFITRHWFDGFTTLHKFDIALDGEGSTKVTYSSRGQVDEQIEHARKTGQLGAITFGQNRDPCDSFYKKMKTVFQAPKTGSVNFENIGVAFAKPLHSAQKGVVSVTSDRQLLKDVDIETLEPQTLVAQEKLHSSLKGPLSAAHPSHDPENGYLYNYNLEVGPVDTYRVFRTSAKDGKTDILATFSGADTRGAYIHSHFLTKHFFILCIWPANFSLKGISILWERNIVDAMEPFDKNAKCTWVVIDRVGSRGIVKKFSSPAMFCFHTINAWEEDRGDGNVDILADLYEYENLDVLKKLFYANLVSDSPTAGSLAKTKSGLVRYKLPSIPVDAEGAKQANKTKPSKGVAEKILTIPSPNSGDLPVINPAYLTKPSRYVYAPIARGLASYMDAVGKTDTQTGECKLWAQERHTPGEAIFIANPDAKAEDDGVLLVVVLDGDRGTSYLLCLDAASMQEIARADAPVPVGYGFHGVHLKNED